MKLTELENILTNTLNKLIEEEEGTLKNKKETDTVYIYERNPDSGEVFRRKKGDYKNRELISSETKKNKN